MMAGWLSRGGSLSAPLGLKAADSLSRPLGPRVSQFSGHFDTSLDTLFSLLEGRKAKSATIGSRLTIGLRERQKRSSTSALPLRAR